MGVAAAKPLVLHDANAVAGLANRVLAYGADRILLGFPGRSPAACRRKVRMGRQSAARRDRALPPPEATLRRAHGAARACSSSAAASAPRR